MQSDFTLPPLERTPRAIALFIAMESEAVPVVRALGLAHGANGAREGRVAGARVVLVTPGRDPELGVDRIGPIHAAIALERALAAQPVDLVVNLGSAGGFAAQQLAIADLVLARDTMFHDARVALAGFDAVARAHARLSLDEARLAQFAGRLGARVGLVSTGSSLDATDAELARFRATGAFAKDMELAALAVACRGHATPLVAMKGITDLVDHHEPTHEVFLRNLARTCERIAAAAGPLIESLVAAPVDTR